MAIAPGGSVALAVLAFALVLAVPLYALQEFRRNVFNRSNADERERERRDEAYRLSYRVIEYAVPMVALLFAFRLEFHESSWLPIWFVAMSYVIFLPYMVFAWREPDVVD